MKILGPLLTAVVVPLLILNVFGGIVAAIWLMVLGQWGSLGLGFAFMLGGGFALGIAMLPGLILVLPATYFHEMNFRIGVVAAGALSLAYTAAVLAAWCTFVLVLFTKRGAAAGALIPFVLWSYAVALAPVQWLSSKEGQSGNDASYTTTLATQIGFIVVVVFAMTTDIRILWAFVIIAGFAFLPGFLSVLALAGSNEAVGFSDGRSTNRGSDDPKEVSELLGSAERDGEAKRGVRVLLKGYWEGVREEYWDFDECGGQADVDGCVYAMCVMEAGVPRYYTMAKRAWLHYEEIEELIANTDLSEEDRRQQIQAIMDRR